MEAETQYVVKEHSCKHIFRFFRVTLLVVILIFSPLLRSLSLSRVFLHRRPMRKKRTVLENIWWEKNLKKWVG